jgi:hypothetical protein
MKASQWLRVTLFRHSDADVALVAPDGVVYNQDSPGVYFERDDAQVMLTVANPVPGPWSVAFTGRETDPGGTAFDYVVESLLPWDDTASPVSSAEVVCARDALGICRTEAYVQLSATDRAGPGATPSGVDRIECSFDAGATWRWCGDANGGQVIVGANSTRGTEFQYRAVDKARNVEAARPTGLIPVERYVASSLTTGQSFRFSNNTTLKVRGARSYTAGSVYVYGNTNTSFELPVEITSGGNVVSSNTNTVFTSVGATGAVTAPAYADSYWLGMATATYSSTRTFTASSPASGIVVVTNGDAVIRAVSGPTTVVALNGSVFWQLPYEGSVTPAATSSGVLSKASKDISVAGTNVQLNGMMLAGATARITATGSRMSGSVYANTVDVSATTGTDIAYGTSVPLGTFPLPLPAPSYSPPPPPSVQGAPSLVSPSNGAVLGSRSVPLVWQGPSGATRWTLNYSTTPTFTGGYLYTSIFSSSTNTTQVTLPAGGTWFWRVKYADPVTGTWSPYSSSWSFSVP